jgi:hypothetical protein
MNTAAVLNVLRRKPPGINLPGAAPALRAAATPATNRVLKNKHQAVNQGVRRFGKRSIFSDM